MRFYCEKLVCFVLFFQVGYTSFASGNPVNTYLGIDQGLSNNFVRCVYQDKAGFMWFGTYNGLNRYDGYEFKIFRNNFKDNRSLVNNWINAVSEDAKGNLWIGTRQGACIYQHLSDNFSPLYYYTPTKTKQQLVSVIRDIEADSQGNMFAGSVSEGLLFFPRGENVANRVPLGNDEVSLYDVTSIKLGNENQLWFSVNGKGLYVYEHKTGKTRLVNSTLRSINCIEVEGSFLWMGTNDGLYRYNIALNSFDKVFNEANKKLEYNVVAGITAAGNHELWVATNGGGVVVLDTESDETTFLAATKEPNSLSSNAVISIWIDKQSRKWIGTLRGGVNVIDPQKERFQNIVSSPSSSNTLISNYILSFYESPENDLWIGTDGGGLSVWNRKKNAYTNYRHEKGNPFSLSDNFVTDIQSDAANNLWVVTYRGGVNRFNNRRFEHYKCEDPRNPGVFLNPIGPNLLEDTGKKIWLSAQQYGLFKLNREKKVFELFDDRLRDLYVLKEDRNGILWGGGINQLVRIDRFRKNHVSYLIGKPVTAVTEDRSGKFWVGTEGGGLVLFNRGNGKIIKRYTTDEGLCSNSILAILEDKEGDLWMSTFNGIAKLNPATGAVKNYYQGDGLQSNQFNYHAALKLSSGEFAFGSINGFTLFRPESILPINGNPRIFLTDVKVDNAAPERDSSLQTRTDAGGIRFISIPYDKAVLSFSFAALEYSAPGKIRYAYYLQGWDRDWNYSGNTRTVVYSHLSEGRYTFRVKNTDAEGVWSKDELSITIVVLPPWYRTWWAWIMYTIMICSAVYFYLTYRSRQTKLQYEIKIAKFNEKNERSEKEKNMAELAREKAEKEKSLIELAMEKAELERERAERERANAEREKERILNEKEREDHEKKISFFTDISHEFRTPLTLILNPIEDLVKRKQEEHLQPDSELSIIYRNARRMRSLVDQLLLFQKAESGLELVHPSKLNLFDLAKEVYLCFIQQAKHKGIQYNFNCSNPGLELYADKEKLEIILFNLVSNAIKYTSQNGRITFTIKELQDKIIVEVEDTGAGIPTQVGDRLFEKFYKAPGASANSKIGFGIGLYLVKHFTDQHKGRISYQSEEGKGTLFTLFLLKGRDHFVNVIEADNDSSPLLINELREDLPDMPPNKREHETGEELVSEKQTILIVDDEEEIRNYLQQMFKSQFIIKLAENGEKGLKAAQKYLPDLIISDINMAGVNGIELCKSVKSTESLSHIPVILLTSSSSEEIKLHGLEGGADDYITKPFDSAILKARITNILNRKNTLQKYFYNEVTLLKDNIRISPEYKAFIEKCIAVVENHLDDDQFNVKTLTAEMGMSHSNIFRKVKLVSGQPVNVFIRYIRLRKAAELFINTNQNVNETAFMVGINDVRYFREQFNKLFGMNPSDYIKKYRKIHGQQFTVDRESINPGL